MHSQTHKRVFNEGVCHARAPVGGWLLSGPVWLTLFGGAFLATEGEILHVPAPRVEVVDTTAAGDAFVGGLAVSLLQGASLRAAVHYATCAGTLAVTKFGAQTSLPSASEVQAFMAALGPPSAP